MDMDLDKALAERFGFETFRPGQRDVAQSVLDGHSALAVMPTGAGKSLCYQLPACVLDGTTLVVSPLIALMKDQVDGAIQRGIRATCINSSVPWPEQQRRLRELSKGAYEIVYVAPERFKNEAFREALAQTTVALFAIDEAHCISQWGHDFRPDYLTLGEVREELGAPITLALTATATPEVQTDILTQLKIREARVVVSGFERPNLFFDVQHTRSDEDKLERMRQVLARFRGESVVVYCATRKQVEEVRARLHHAGFLVGTYHGGMSDKRRTEMQDAFMSGDIPVLIATNAFGMGVDKSDVRAIIHYNLPGSLEGYYQEAGRAGRDGEPSYCLLLYNPNDRGVHDFFIDLSYPTPDVIMSVWSELRQYGLGSHSIGAEQIANHINRSSKKTNVHSGGVTASLKLLKQAMHIDHGWRDGFPWVEVRDLSRTRDLRVDWDQVALRREIALRQLNDVVRFANISECRQLQLLKYFRAASSFGNQCHNCDQCCGVPDLPEQPVNPVPDSLETLIQKALSGVARTRGRVGTHLVCAMLRGSGARVVTSHQLDQLSTYGILGYLNPEQLMELFDVCERHRMIIRDSKGVVALTDEGVAVMCGENEPPAGLVERLRRKLQPA